MSFRKLNGNILFESKLEFNEIANKLQKVEIKDIPNTYIRRILKWKSIFRKYYVYKHLLSDKYRIFRKPFDENKKYCSERIPLEFINDGKIYNTSKVDYPFFYLNVEENKRNTRTNLYYTKRYQKLKYCKLYDEIKKHPRNTIYNRYYNNVLLINLLKSEHTDLMEKFLELFDNPIELFTTKYYIDIQYSEFRLDNKYGTKTYSDYATPKMKDYIEKKFNLK
jgi:hypothetical protein